MKTWFRNGLNALNGHSTNQLTDVMRPLAFLLFLIMLGQPAWASTPYTCFAEQVSGISNGEFVNPEVKPFKINVSDDGVNFVADSFFHNLSIGTKDSSDHEQFRASFEPSAFIHFDYPYLYYGSAYPRNTVSLFAICRQF
mgnify:FL=1